MVGGFATDIAGVASGWGFKGALDVRRRGEGRWICTVVAARLVLRQASVT